LYAWAITDPGSLNDNKDFVMQQHKDLYPSDGVVDNLAYAATWLYKVTKKAGYLADAKKYYSQTSFSTDSQTFQLDNKRPALSVLLASLTDDKIYLDDAQNYFDSYLQQKVKHTPRGLAYPYHWGGGRFGGNVAWLAFMHAKNKAVDEAYRARLRNYGFFQVSKHFPNTLSSEYFLN
jgi:endoglucanase